MEDVKIALCLSGKIRSGFFCFPYIYDSFLNGRKNVKTFIHTWDNDRIIQLYQPEKLSIENNQVVDDYLLEIGRLKDVQIEGNIYNNVSMFHSIKKSFDLVPKNYDIVIRCRFDLFLEEKIELDAIIDEILSNKYDIYIPQESYNYGGYNDQIAIGSYESMKIYSNCISELKTIAGKIKRWHPESILKEQLDNNDIKIKQNDYKYNIVRKVISSEYN